MGQALYRKYRSRSLDEVVGQEHITTTLQRALKDGKISHAYLFTGPRGVGKTSVARILAYAVNGLKYQDDTPHLDVIEIDAASNRRIDEIRELRDRVHITPTSAKYKVYIIDEVHMLTKEAFNALLKTLEEPPGHAIFILATTEAHKVPDTIISRTQRFTFKPIADEAMLGHLRTLAEAEKITVSDDALQLIAKHGAGSFRDSISLLDQASSSGGQIDALTIEKLLGHASEAAIESLVESIRNGDAVGTASRLNELLAQSSPEQIVKQVSTRLQTDLIAGKYSDHESVTSLLRQLIEVPASHDPQALLYIHILDAVLSHSLSINETSSRAPKLSEPVAAVTQAAPSAPSSEAEPQPQELWPRVLAEAKKHHATLYSIARMAKPKIVEQSVMLTFSFPFHQKQLAEPKNSQILIDIFKRVSGQDYTIQTQLLSKPDSKEIAPSKPNEPTIKTISNIFGDAEVLES